MLFHLDGYLFHIWLGNLLVIRAVMILVNYLYRCVNRLLGL